MFFIVLSIIFCALFKLFESLTVCSALQKKSFIFPLSTERVFFIICFLSFSVCSFSHSTFRWRLLPALARRLSTLQATAPVSIPVGPDLAELGSVNGTGPGTGTGNGISVSWQSPPVIFKGALVSEALSHSPLSFNLSFHLLLFSQL